MHQTAFISGSSFAQTYGIKNGTVIDLGGLSINGSLRNCFENLGMKFISVDIEEHESVDIVIPPGEKLPFDDMSIDLVISTSTFEHDPCFWLTFKELTRIIKPTGFIYINCPSSGMVHRFPGDNWRFYPDAGQALAFWSGKQISNENIYPVKLIESFNILGSQWNDFVCVWKRVDIIDKEINITLSDEIINNIGILEQTINNYGLETIKK